MHFQRLCSPQSFRSQAPGDGHTVNQAQIQTVQLAIPSGRVQLAVPSGPVSPVGTTPRVTAL